jgi:hypothetical protein
VGWVSAKLPSQGCDVSIGQPATAKQFVRLVLKAVCKQLDVMQYRECGASRSPINKIAVTMLTAKYGGVGGDRLGREPAGP